MSDPEAASIQVQHLRQQAAHLLEESAQQGDPGRRDNLVREALALLDHARVLREWAEEQARMAARPGGATDSLHTRID